MRRMKTLSILLLLLAVVSCKPSSDAPTIVFIVRHAEKADNSDDPPLAPAGVERAQALVRAAGDAGVKAIYSSQFKRNRGTVQPLADHLRIPITEMRVTLDNPGNYGKELAGNVLAKHAGETVVVVSHRNTIPAIIEGLTGKAGQETTGDAYNDLFIVVMPAKGDARLIKAQYGQ